MINAYFLHQIKHNKTTDAWDKGIVVSAKEDADNYASARQGYHAYLGAYAYGKNADTDFVSCHITDTSGEVLMDETWVARNGE